MRNSVNTILQTGL